MKRPGGFDREPSEYPEEQIEPVVEPSRGPAWGSFFGVPETATQGEDQALASAPESGHASAGDTEVGGAAAEEPSQALDPDVQPTAVIEERVAAPGQVSRALAWVGIGQPKDPVRAADRRVRTATRSRKRRERRESQRFAREARRKQRGWLIAGGLVLALAAFVAVCAFTPVTAVREIRVEGLQAVAQADVERALARFEGVPLALVEDKAVHKALEVFPLIQRYQIERIPPHTLVVQLEERMPVLSIDTGSGFDLFDAAGVLIGHSDAAAIGVPVATGAITDLTSPAFGSAARALRDMPDELRARVIGVSATSAQDLSLTLDDGLTVIWGGDADTKRKSVVLQSMLAALGDRELEYVDVSSSDAPVFR